MGAFLQFIPRSGLYVVLAFLHIPILQGEEQGQCPSLAENPICPCYNFKEGLFLECPSATPGVVKNVLSKIRGTIHSLSIYDLESSITELEQDLFPTQVNINNLQISQSQIHKISNNAFSSVSDELVSLSIISSKLSKIPYESLSKLYHLEVLDLQLNNIDEIQDNAFSNLSLKKLNLRGNKIENISANAFNSLGETLTELDLTGNFLNVFPLETLGRLSKLTNLKLAWNRISSIPNDSRAVLQSLATLDANSNLFTKIDKNSFRGMPNLKTLIFFSNQVKEIENGAFHALEKLEIIDLSRNKIIMLPKTTFQMNRNIRSIDLSHNHLHHIDSVFSNLLQLSEIFLSENNILDVPDDAFENSDAITVLNLEHNGIQYLQPNCFSSLKNLRQLHMGTNFLKKIPQKAFKSNHKLETLSLDNNEIDELDELVFNKLVGLKEIRLQNNKLSHVKRNVFSPLPSLQELHLQNNMIQSIDSQAFITLKSLQHVNLQNNRLTAIGDVFPNRNSSLVSVHLGANFLSILKNSSLSGQINVRIMWLSQNNIKILTSNLFNDLLNIQRLYLKKNNIVHIENKTFSYLNKLKFLDLSENKLMKLSNETFYKLVTLEELYLQCNNINQIAKDTFQFLSKLKILDLSQNEIIVLDFDISTLPIKHLRLNNNSISIIETSSLKSLPNLSNLEMTHNHLTWEDIIQIQIPVLKSLTLSSNNFTTLENKTFSHLPSLQTLSLEYSNISQLPSAIFIKNQNLLRISLAFNNLKDIHKDVFAYTTILQDLNLQGNYLSDFPHVALFNVTSLEVLNLCQNQLNNVDFFKFIGLQNLRTLNLCDNKISMLNGFNSPVLKNLISLNLSKNKLSVLPPNFFQHSVALKDIDLSNNLFKFIPSNGLSEAILPALTTLNMSSNLLLELFQAFPTKPFPILEELVITRTNLSIITSKDFDNFPSLKTLILSQNCILRLSPGAFLKLKNLVYLDITENKLDNLPRERLQGLYSVRNLNVSHNTIRELEEFTPDLQSLQKLDISFNQITRINKDTFRGLQSLTELFLSNNWLTSISAEAFWGLNKLSHIDLSRNYFEVVNINLLRSLETQIKTISFDENPLTCNCESQELWKWMQDHYKIILKSNSKLYCEHPNELHGQNFLQISSEKICDVSIIVRVAIQDIQPSSVVVSWQIRNVTGLVGYKVAYFSVTSPAYVSGTRVNVSARSTRLTGLSPGSRYTICVIADPNLRTYTLSDSSVPGARISIPNEKSSIKSKYGEDTIMDNIRFFLKDTFMSKCTNVSTIEIFGAALDSPFSNTYMGIADILTRRLSLVVGCCIGFIVFVVLVSALGYIKTKKRPVIGKLEAQQPPQYISYDNFATPHVDVQTTEMDLNTVVDNAKSQ